MEGSLKLKIGFWAGWKAHYFVLNEGILTYCENKGSPVLGSIHLRIADIKADESDTLQISINSGTKDFTLRAPDKVERMKWLNALMETQQLCLKEEELKKYPDKEIKELEGRLSAGNQAIIRDSNLESLESELAQLWEKQAMFDETLSRILKTESRPLANELSELGNEIKYCITRCVMKIKQEKKNMLGIMNKYEEHILQSPRSPLYSPKRAPAQDEKDLTQFESFRDDEEEGKGEEPKRRYVSLENTNELLSKHLSPVARRNTPVIVTSRSQSKFEIPLQLDSLDKTIRILLTQNPAFTKYPLPSEKTRTRMPHFIDPKKKISVWEIVKKMIGQDITRMAVPVFLNEPISMLQRLCEQLEYSELLDKADKIPDSGVRMAYSVAFAFSSLQAMVGRIKKPFNPILGETFEYVPADGSFRFVSEQVSHHPPISAGHAENDSFIWYGDTAFKNSFKGASFEVTLLGQPHIILKTHKDHIVYKKPTTACCNLIFGEMYMDNYGTMEFINIKTGETALMNFKARGWGGKNAYEADGYIKDRQGNIKFSLVGKWDSFLKCTNMQTKEEITLWTPRPKPAQWAEQYSFTEFSKQMNYLPTWLVPSLPATDCRLRPDQRALEHGDEDLADKEKFRLEEKQRARRRELAAAQETHKAKWFYEKKDTITGERIFEYKGGYWEARESKSFTDILDLFT